MTVERKQILPFRGDTRMKGMLFVFFLALTIRLLLFVQVSGKPEVAFQPDSRMYAGLAEGLLKYGSLSYPDNPTERDAERMPGYPLFIAMVLGVPGGNFQWLLVVQLILDVFSCILIYIMGEALWEGSGFTSGVLASGNLGMISYSLFVLNDSLFLFVFLIVTLGLVRFLRVPAWKGSILLGMGLAAAAMVRPVVVYLPLLVLLLFFCVLPIRFRKVSFLPLCKVLLLGLVLLISLLPWSFRNNHHFGRMNLTAQSGEHLLQYIVPFTWQYSRGIPFIEGMNRANLQFSEKMKSELIDTNQLNPFEKSDLQVKLALDVLRSEPKSAIAKAWLFGIIKNLFSPGLIDLSYLLGVERPHFFATEGTTALERAWNFIAGMKGWFGWAVVVNILILMLARVVQVWGLILLMRRNSWEALLFILIVAYFLLVSGPVGYAKYRLPFEPILIVLLAIGLKDLKERWRLEERFALKFDWRKF